MTGLEWFILGDVVALILGSVCMILEARASGRRLREIQRSYPELGKHQMNEREQRIYDQLHEQLEANADFAAQLAKCKAQRAALASRLTQELGARAIRESQSDHFCD